MSNLRHTFIPSAVRSADGQTDLIDFSGQFQACRGMTAVLNVTAVAGSLPTLDVYLQQELPDGSFQDYATFAQVTGIAKRVLLVMPEQGSVESAGSDKQLVAGRVQKGPLSSKWRAAWKISGTLVSFTFAVDVELFECES